MPDCLLLNGDGQPVSLLPLSVICWKEAIKHLVLEKGKTLAWHENWIVRSSYWETRVPAIIMLSEYTKPKTTVRYSKSNVFLRDRFKCQYCGVDVTKRSATLDHVMPVSHGGRSTWENSTTSCAHCNSTKGNKKHIKPKEVPHKPSYWELIDKRKSLPFEINHPDWEMYLR